MATDNDTDPGSADRLLGIYLADHRAAAAAGSARARRFAEANAETFIADTAQEVSREIDEDVTLLDEILGRLGCRPSAWKNLAARAAELVGRLKLNGRLRGYSPLSRLVELEVLVAGIVTKQSLWHTLGLVQQQRTELDRFDFEELQQRAVRQRMKLEAHRQAAVAEALSSPTPDAARSVAPVG
jgi:hypothetical protein